MTTIGACLRLSLLVLVLTGSVVTSAAVNPGGEGSRTFVARPQFGAAVFDLPARVTWRSTATDGGLYKVALTADINVQPVLTNVKALSAKALNRDVPCGDLVQVRAASAKLTGPRSLRYDLRFHFGKRICAGAMPLELPAEVACASNVIVAAAGSVVQVDVQGATTPPCQIAGDAVGISEMMGTKIFKRHLFDLAKILPKEFQGVVIDVRSLAIDLPPAAATLHIAGESTMSPAQFTALMTRLEAAAPKRPR